jgi:hypothetical protein
MRWIDFRKDDGAVAVLVAILFSSLVIVGLLAIVVDGGSLYRERRVLQNAADSATLANTRECALETSNCSSNSFAAAYTNANSPDSLSNVKELCGLNQGVSTISLNTCTPISVRPFACKNIGSTYPRFLRVIADTKTTSGTTINLPFGSALGTQYSAGKKIEACAQAAWGKANSAPVVFPIAFPACGFNSTNNTQIWHPIFSNNNVACSITDIFGANFSFSGNLNGYTQIYNGGCPNEVTPRTYSVGDQITTESSFIQLSSNPSTGCATLAQFISVVTPLIGKIIYVPVVGDITSGGIGNGKFEIIGFYAVKFLGAKFKNPGSSGGAIFGSPPTCTPSDNCTPANYNWPSKCSNSGSCFYGKFSRGVVPGADVDTDPNYPALGAQAVQLLP